jgi:two-component system chemotaxis sensor kinase CheA
LVEKLEQFKNLGLQEASQKKADTPNAEVSNSQVVSDVLEPITTIRVDVKVLDHLMNLTEELLVEKMRLEQIIGIKKEKLEDIPIELRRSVENMSRLISDLQYTVTETHMVPLWQLFEHFPRLVRDLSKEHGKNVEFQATGQEIELDRTIIDRLGEPLIHLLRNAIDHGIDKTGKILVTAERFPDSVEISVYNEGRPIDWQMVVQSALDRGIIDQKTKSAYSTQLQNSDFVIKNSEIENLIFYPKFSTKKLVTETSGRGVGLKIVKSVIESFGGKVSLQTKQNGTRFSLSLPLTVAIVKALLVQVSDNIFALPFSQVDRLVRIPFSNIKKAFDQEMAVIDEEDIPLVRLGQSLGLDENSKSIFLPEKELESFRYRRKEELIIITKPERFSENENLSQVGLVVDDVFSKQDIIVKPLKGILKRTKGFSGVTILGDGRPALILDVTTLI